MKNLAWLWAVAACGCLNVAGCLPEKNIVWSPAGQTAGVRGGDGLHFIDAQGKLLGQVKEPVFRAAWFPDSRRLVLAIRREAHTWADLEKVMPPDRLAKIAAEAEQMFKEIQAYKGDPKEFKCSSQPADSVASQLYLQARHEKEWTAWMAKLPSQGDKLEKVSRTYLQLQVYEWTAPTAKPGKEIAKFFEPLADISISPNGKALAFTGGPGAEFKAGAGDPLNLYVAAIDGSASFLPVAERVGPSADWSRDGTTLAYVHGTAESGKALSLVCTRKVCDEQGSVLDKPPAEETLALTMGAPGNARYLGEGSVLFASTQVELPLSAADLSPQAGLFRIGPEKQAKVMRVLPPDKSIGWFEVSPDGSKVVFFDVKGRVAVVTLAGGAVETVQDSPKETGETKETGEAKETHYVMSTIPVWRTNDELCLVTLPGSPLGSPKRPEVVLWSAKPDAKPRSRIISHDWSDGLVNGLVETWHTNSPTTAPTTAPATGPTSAPSGK